MINKQRVMRFRALIQFVIFLLVAVPIILIITLCFRMVGMLGEITAYLERASGTSFTEQTEPAEAASIAPENQSLTNHGADGRQSLPPQEISREESPAGVQPNEAAAESASAAPLAESPSESAASPSPSPNAGGAASPVPAAASASGGAGSFSGAGANPVTGA